VRRAISGPLNRTPVPLPRRPAREAFRKRPERRRLISLAALSLVLATTGLGPQLLAQNVPTPGSMNDFSDGMVEQPDTSMVIEPIDPADAPYTEEPVSGDGTIPSPEAPYAPDLPEIAGNYEGPIGVTGIFNGNVDTGCSYDPLGHSAHRVVDDIVVPNSLGKYPLKMTRYYNSRQQYYAFTAIGLGPSWAHEYSWLVWTAGHKVVSPHGNVYDDSCGVPVGISEGWEGPRPCPSPCPSPGTGTWRLADGGRVHFDSWHVTYIEDPYGLRTRIAYIHDQNSPQNGQRVKVTEPGGRCLWFIYGDHDRDLTWLITRVEAYDSDGSPGSPTHPTGHLIDWVNYTYVEYDPISPGIQNRRKKMLRQVYYSDGTPPATYDYRTDNVPESPSWPPYTSKWYPLLQRCDDVRYNGPMRSIRYEYQNSGPHGAIINEKSPNVAGAVSAPTPGAVFGPPSIDTFTETRGDGPTRTFTYTHLSHCQAPDCVPCDDYENNDAWPYRAPQQMLDHYTDFQGHTTQLAYNNKWYINSVTDANGDTTTYERGDPPPNGIGEILTITHPAGATYPASSIHYTYSDHGHYMMSITDENAKTTTLHRDGHNRIYQIDYPQDVNTPASHEAFTYCDQADSQCNNTFGQVKRHQLKNSAYVHYRYNSRGLLIDKWEPTLNASAVETDPKTHYDYYTAADGKLGWIDRVKKMTGPAPNWQWSQQASETYEYDMTANNQPCAGRGLVTKITHADYRYQSFKYNQWGNKVNEWNELGERTDYAYDSYNRVTSAARIMTLGPNEVTTYTYRPTNGNGTSPYLHTTNNPDTITSPTGIVTSNVYDQNFRKTSTTVAGRTTWFHYDPVGNQDCVTDPRGTGACSPTYTTSTEYDTRDRKWKVWDAQGHLTTSGYDSASNVTSILRPDQTTETKTYDALNRVLTDKVPKAGPASSPTEFVNTTFQYNPSGTLQWVRDGENHTTSFQYNDPSDLRTKMIYSNGSSKSWAYDDAHNLKSRATIFGQTQYFGYDNRNRKYADWWSNNAEWRYFGLDSASRLRRPMNGMGAWNTNIISDVHREYDHAGRLTLDRQALTLTDQTTMTKDVNYEYNVALRGTDGKPTRMYVTPVPSPSYDYDFRYDDMGRFEKIFIHGNAVQFQYSYDDASNETQRYNWFNHVNQIYNPDNLNRPGRVELQHDGTVFARQVYDYYPIGRLHTVTRGNRQDQFVYYLDGELHVAYYDVTAAEAPDPSESPPAEDPTKEKTVDDFVALPDGMDPNALETAARTVTYDLDNAGNRNWVSDSVVGTTVHYTPNNINQYTAVDGSTISNGHEHEVGSYQGPNDVQPVYYTYMKDQYLTRVTSGTNSYDLAYDALGRCVKRTVHTDQGGDVTKYYIYEGERPILEYKSNGALAGKNLYGKGVDEILMRYDPTLTQEPRTFYYQQDHEGSVTHLTYIPPPGISPILEYYRYDVFGKPTIYGPPPNWSLRAASLYSNRFLFTGREYSAMFGFYEYRARAYHAGLGRFMSEDPKLFVRGAGLGKAPDDWRFSVHPDEAEFNLFRYVHNDPLDLTDPMGLEGEVIIYREDGRSSTNNQAIIVDKGRSVASFRANENRFIRLDNGPTRGPRSGEYSLLPKVNAKPGDSFPNGQPSITAKQYADPSKANYAPGRAGPEYKAEGTVRVHEKSSDGRPDSTGCVTACAPAVDRVTKLMNDNMNNGGTKVIFVDGKQPVDGHEVRRAEPVVLQKYSQ
jgi:RHS repeat-associated protein